MAWLDRRLKQRIVGALVLVALAVIFLPMLLTRHDEQREIQVNAPPMPSAPAVVEPQPQPVEVPEPPAVVQGVEQPEVSGGEPVVVEDASAPAQSRSLPPPIAPVPSVGQAPAQPTTARPVEPTSGLDAAGLPVSWSIQLASLSSRANAEALVQRLRSSGYNGYMRSVDGMNRVFVGPVVDRAEATRMRDQLKRQLQLNGFLVRFEPERQ